MRSNARVFPWVLTSKTPSLSGQRCAGRAPTLASSSGDCGAARPRAPEGEARRVRNSRAGTPVAAGPRARPHRPREHAADAPPGPCRPPRGVRRGTRRHAGAHGPPGGK